MALALTKSTESCGAATATTAQLDIDIDIPVFDLFQIQSQGLVDKRFDQDSMENVLLSEFRRSFENWGCFRLVNHGIPDTILGRVEILCRDVFKLPRETKEKNISSLTYGGYIKGGSTAPFFESLGIVPEFEAIQEFSDLMWPHGNQNFCQIMKEYFERMKELSDRIHKIILASLGVTNYYALHFEDCKHRFRMNEYQVSCDEAAGSITLPAHTDGSIITILQEDEVGGLQVLSKAGNWVEVKPVANSFIIFAGDPLQAWSNNTIPSIKHRVIVKGQQSRLSLVLLRLFPDEMEIEAPPELVDNEHPRRYRAFQFSKYIAFKREQPGKWENPLDAYAANDQDAHTESS